MTFTAPSLQICIFFSFYLSMTSFSYSEKYQSESQIFVSEYEMNLLNSWWTLLSNRVIRCDHILSQVCLRLHMKEQLEWCNLKCVKLVFHITSVVLNRLFHDYRLEDNQHVIAMQYAIVTMFGLLLFRKVWR